MNMHHASQAQFGRPVEAVLHPDQHHCIDKWQALNALTDAAESYDLSHRTLGVLKALMSFLPGRMIHPMPGEAIVFPSNRTLSHRMNGMPDSTLRRHLARLVSAGIVSRHDSPNRKRYARGAGQAGIAFGFDLSPIARHATALSAAATAAQEARAQLATLRATLAKLRDDMIQQTGETELTENARRALRRKPDAADLERFINEMQHLLCTEEMSAADAQNERHIQTESKYISDSEPVLPKKTKSQDQMSNEKDQAISVALVLDRCRAFQSYFPDKVRGWADLVRIADRLAMMLGIDAPVFHDACKSLGPERASIVVLCILEQIDRIENPGGYLRHMSQRGRAGGFDVRPMLQAIKLSADN